MPNAERYSGTIFLVNKMTEQTIVVVAVGTVVDRPAGYRPTAVASTAIATDMNDMA